MTNSKLSPAAQEFFPSWSDNKYSQGFGHTTVDEASITHQELEELERVEQWVETLVELEEMERDHCIALALKLAPKEKIVEIRRRAMHQSARW